MADAVTEGMKIKFDEFFDRHYKEQIEALMTSYPEKLSLAVNFKDLEKFDPELADQLLETPDLVAGASVESLKEKMEFVMQDGYEPHVRFFGQETNSPLVQDVGSKYISKMIQLDSLIVKRSEINPRVKVGTYKCTYCEATIKINIDKEELPERCPQCKRTSMKAVPEESRFINLQKIAVQDPLEKLRGNTPTWQLEVWIEDDLVNTVIPGDRIELTGILRIRPRRNQRGKLEKNLYTMFLDTVSIVPKQKEFAELNITEEEERRIKELAKDPTIFEKVASSIAPSIYGYKEIKQAVALQLFGGTFGKLLVDGGIIRSDMHILLIGDPGSAKTRILQSVSKLVPKGIYVSGKSVTGGGMTAIAERDDFSDGGWTLKAGALVLGSGGIVCMTENTEIYTGQSLLTAKQVWDALPGRVYMTKSGREAKNAMIPVTTYNRKSRTTMQWNAYSIMRKSYRGEIVRLTFASGLTLELTPEHLLRRLTNVKNLWVKAGSVKEGQELRAPTYVYGPKITLDVGPDEAYVMGCIYGYGFIDMHQIVVSQAKVNYDVVEAIAGRMSSKFAVCGKGDRDSMLLVHGGKQHMLTSRMYQMYSTDKEILSRTLFLLKSPSTDNILMLKDESLWAFMAGVFDTDGGFNHAHGTITAARMYPTKSEHELKVMLYALRRLGIYARIHGKTQSMPIIQITGQDVSVLIDGIRSYSAKVRREADQKLVIRHKNATRGVEKVVKVEHFNYDGYVYDLSVGKYHNYEASLVYIHNCIDEFDKVGDEDRAALHEALESQTISVAKAGIIATFNARAAVLAAANPKYGRFDVHIYPAEQFDIPPTLLSRFDLIFPIKDIMDVQLDKEIAKHILLQHEAAGAQLAEMQKFEQVELPPIDTDFLRKYIAYARKSVAPRLSPEARAKIEDYYVDLRKKGAQQGAVPITPRQIEGLIRMAEASAKTRLAPVVEAADAERAIALSEYMLRTLAIDRGGRRDIDTILTGMPREKVDKLNAVLTIIKDLEEKEGSARMQRITEEAERSGIDSISVLKYLAELERSGDVFSPKPGVIKVVNREAE